MIPVFVSLTFMTARLRPAQGIIFASLIGLIVWVFVGALVAQARDATVSGCITDTGQLVGTQVADRGYVGGDITAVDTGEVIGRLNLKNTKGQPARSFSTPVSRVTPAEATWGHRAGENEWGYAYFPLCTPPTTTPETTWPTSTTTPTTSTTLPSTVPTSTTSTTEATTTTVPSTTMPTSTTSASPPTTSSTTSTTAPSSSTSEAPTTTGPSGSSSTTSTPSTSAPSTTTTASTSSTPSTTDAPAERSTSELPRTGLSVLVLVIVGLGLVALGAVLWLGVKRDEWSQR